MLTGLHALLASRLVPPHGAAGAAVAAAARPRGDNDLNPGAPPRNGPLLPAAVLVPMVQRPDGCHVLFTRRTAHLSKHGGQISFPGGRLEPGDADAEACALRETEEEIGLPPSFVEIVGRLDTYVTVTSYSVTPVVGMVSPGFTLMPDAGEVAEVFEVPLEFLMDPQNHQRHGGMVNGVERHWYAIPFGDYYIWGATAGMLMNLYQRLNDK